MLKRARRLSLPGEQVTQNLVRLRQARVGAQGGLHLPLRLIELASPRQSDAVVVSRPAVVGPQTKRDLEMISSLRHVAGRGKQIRQIAMSFRIVRLDSDRLAVR
jgi:hypothetical protein